jgi:hypothetical protein
MRSDDRNSGGSNSNRGTGGREEKSQNTRVEKIEKSERTVPLTREDRQVVRDELPPTLPADGGGNANTGETP